MCSSGAVNASGSKNIASIFSHRGMKGMNQDCMVVWEVLVVKADSESVNHAFPSVNYNPFLLGIWVPRGHDLLWRL